MDVKIYLSKEPRNEAFNYEHFPTPVTKNEIFNNYIYIC